MPTLDTVGLWRDSTVLAVLPFFRIYGMNVLLNDTLVVRATLVTAPKFDLPQFLELHQSTTSTSRSAPRLSPWRWSSIPIVDNYDLSALKNIQSGAAPLSRELVDAVEMRLDVHVVQGFGMTEASPVTNNSFWGATPIESIGSPVANMERKVVDPSPPDLPEIPPPSQGDLRSPAGEMWVRGPQVMVGYLNNEKANRTTLTEDGWLRTGDVVDYDVNGVVFEVDRAKEPIKYKEVAPVEFEA